MSEREREQDVSSCISERLLNYYTFSLTQEVKCMVCSEIGFQSELIRAPTHAVSDCLTLAVCSRSLGQV